MQKNGLFFWLIWGITFVFIVGSTYYYFRGYLPNQASKESFNEEEYRQMALRNSFKTGAKIILTSAAKQYTTAPAKAINLTVNGSTTPNAFCYTLLETGIISAANFRGHVIVDVTNQENPLFYLYLSNPDFHVKYATLTEIESNEELIISETAAADIDKCPTGAINFNE